MYWYVNKMYLKIKKKKKWCVLFFVDDVGFDGLKLYMVNRVYFIDRGWIEVWVDNDVDVINIVDYSFIGFKV